MRERILKMLREQEDYVSGQALCQYFGVSRTAVWKHIQALKNEGYAIDSVSNRGYKLLKEPDLVTAAQIKPRLRTQWAAHNLVYYKETDSTNIRAKALGAEGAAHGTLVVSEQQNAGRGRRGKSWVSPPGESVYMTLLLKPDIAIPNASMLTLVAAMAIARAVQTALDDREACKIKWPNDIIVGGKKICGILTEMSTEEDYINSIVIGMGINVNTASFAPEVAEVATSLRLETGRRFCRAQVIADAMAAFEAYYDVFIQTQDLSGLLEEYNHMLINCGRQVRVVGSDGEWLAVAEGITKSGALVVMDGQGNRREIIAGEVSVRGVLGYV